MTLDRRRFLTLSALGVTVPFLRGNAVEATLSRPSVLLQRVRLLDGPWRDAMLVNARSLLALEPERLLHMFRLTAGLPSAATPLGGWEAPDNELRGHYTGHHLSALALLHAQTGEPEARTRAETLLAGLIACQEASGTGYLSAFPEELFDRLRAGKKAWAPFYTLHKLLAGLLDVHEHLGLSDALGAATRLAQWVERWTQPLGEEAMARVLEREYGGMNEALYRLARITGETRYATLAARFNHERLFAPLVAGRDELTGLHVNTTVPKLIGALEGAAVEPSARLQVAAEHFYRMVSEERCYVTGGTSNGESWNTPAGTLKGELSGYTQESCVSYNLMKLAHRLHGLHGDPRRMDDYERLLVNGILGVQHPKDGAKLYYLPLAPGYWKLYGTPLADFWCCTGSMAEAHAKFGEAVYTEREGRVGVELFIASRLAPGINGLSVRQETRFPEEHGTCVCVETAPARRVTLEIRIPGWARGGTAHLNGRPLEAFAEGPGRLTLTRVWRSGDTLKIRCDCALEATELPGDPEHIALTCGPVVLAARLGSASLDAAHLRAPPTAPRTVPEYPLEALPMAPLPAALRNPQAVLQPVPGKPMTFRYAGPPMLEFVPLWTLQDERFAVYLPVAGAGSQAPA